MLNIIGSREILLAAGDPDLLVTEHSFYNRKQFVFHTRFGWKITSVTVCLQIDTSH